MISPFVLLLLTIIKAGCVLHSTRTVKLSSKNLRTFLTWEPTTGSSSTLYQVEYKQYDDSRWIQKKECWNITMVQCDLTKDITHVTHRMTGRVRAISHSTVSDWMEARMSIPHIDMTIDPPILNLVPETNSMQVHIRPSFENCTGVAKMEYTINFKQRNGSILSTKTTELHTHRMEDLASATEYCVTVSSKIWISHTQDTPHDYESAMNETCAFTETDHRHLQLIMRLTVGLIIPLLLISALLFLIWAFRSIYRPPAALPLNLIFTVEEWKTLQRKSYVDVKQCDDDSADRITSNWIQSKAKTNLYVRLPQRMLLSEDPIVKHSHEPLMGFSTPPPLLEGVRRVQGYAPQLSCPAAQTDESYGVAHHGLGLTLHDCSALNMNQLTFSSAEPKSGSMLASTAEALYINSEQPEPVYTNAKHPEPVYTNAKHPEPVDTKSDHSKSIYINSEQPKSVYANSEHPKPISTDSEQVYTNYKCSEPVYTNLEHPKPVDTNSDRFSTPTVA